MYTESVCVVIVLSTCTGLIGHFPSKPNTLKII